jgi:hypothetical protein
MSRSEANTFLKDASRNEPLHTRDGVRQEDRKRLVCDARIGADEPTFQVRGVLVHLRRAAYRRRLVRR